MVVIYSSFIAILFDVTFLETMLWHSLAHWNWPNYKILKVNHPTKNTYIYFRDGHKKSAVSVNRGNYLHATRKVLYLPPKIFGSYWITENFALEQWTQVELLTSAHYRQQNLARYHYEIMIICSKTPQWLFYRFSQIREERKWRNIIFTLVFTSFF